MGNGRRKCRVRGGGGSQRKCELGQQWGGLGGGKWGTRGGGAGGPFMGGEHEPIVRPRSRPRVRPRVCARACWERAGGRGVQVSKGVAYPVNGLLMGALDWRFLTAAMWAANAAALAVLARAGPGGGLWSVWVALNAFMALQSAAGLARIAAAAGPWRALRLARPAPPQ